MKPEMLETVGQNLFGAHWIGELAARLNVAPRTVRRWARGEFAMPKDAQEALGVIAQERVREAARALEGLLGAGQN
jgi:hypothetical protein